MRKLPKEKLLLLVSLPPPTHGSNVVNQYVVDNALLREKYDVRVFPLRYASSIADIGRLRFRKVASFLRFIVGLLFFLRDFRPRYAYFVPAVTGLSFYRDCLFALILKTLKIRIIFHLHGRGINRQIRNPLIKKIYVWFFRNEHIIQLSPLLFKDIEEIVQAKQVSFLPNGIEAGATLSQRQHRLDRQRIRQLFLSNLVVTKGPLVLLEACKILMDRGYDFETIYVGNATQELSSQELQRRITAYGLEGRVRYLGPKYGKEKEEILLASDVFVFPTYYPLECFPLTLLEAMAYALPIVATSLGAIPEIIDHGRTGFILQGPDSGQLADKLQYFIEDRERCARMGSAGRRKFEENYRLDSFHANFLHLMSKFTEGV
jgi:glycosyltransferase involved in cell wall biosynthesis